MLEKPELFSVLTTAGMAVVLIIAAIVCAHNYVAGGSTSLYLAAAVGALGGVIHEIAQSGGKIVFFEKKADGFYLGSISGMVLGGVAGILAAKALFTAKPPEWTAAQLIYEALLAGLALKGVVEAAGGQIVPPGSTAPGLPPLPPPPNEVPPNL